MIREHVFRSADAKQCAVRPDFCTFKYHKTECGRSQNDHTYTYIPGRGIVPVNTILTTDNGLC